MKTPTPTGGQVEPVSHTQSLDRLAKLIVDKVEACVEESFCAADYDSALANVTPTLRGLLTELARLREEKQERENQLSIQIGVNEKMRDRIDTLKREVEELREDKVRLDTLEGMTLEEQEAFQWNSLKLGFREAIDAAINQREK